MTLHLDSVSHPELAIDSARRCRDRLYEVVERPEASVVARDAGRALADTLQAAIEAGPALRPDQVTFGIRSLDALDGSPELEWFHTPFQLGLGSDAAPIVVMGTEIAGRAEDPGEAAWGSLQTALILSGSPEPVVRSLVRESSWWAELERRGLPPSPWRPWHIQPNDLYRVETASASHTWCQLARILAEDPEDWRSLLAIGATPGIGALSYQIERSGRPATEVSGGTPPTVERTDWLVAVVLPVLRRTARILILHGFGTGGTWEASDLRLVNAFLGLRPGTISEVDWGERLHGKRGDWLWHRREGDHLVIWTRAFGWGWRRPYLAAVRSLVRG